jgi:hypothetical protein
VFGNCGRHMAHKACPSSNDTDVRRRMAYSALIRSQFRSNPSLFMTLIASARIIARSTGKDWRAHLLPVVVGGFIAAAALTSVAYLLWPTWDAEAGSGPARLPISIGSTLFNVPSASIRMKIQRHTGPQERIDLSFSYPSLQPPEAPKRVSAATVEDTVRPIDRIFLSIAAHHGSLAPEERVATILPRYLEPTQSVGEDGLTTRAFREGSPYSGEDLFFASSPGMVARCSREAATPGMCLSERRIEGADLTFRFPRSWLAQWRQVADAMDRLTQQLHGSK